MKKIPRIIISPFTENADDTDGADFMVQGLVQQLGKKYQEGAKVEDASRQKHRTISNFFHFAEKKKENDQLETIFKQALNANPCGEMAPDTTVIPSFKITNSTEEATARARDAVFQILDPQTDRSLPKNFLVLDGQKDLLYFTVLSTVHGPLQVSCQTENNDPTYVTACRQIEFIQNTNSLSSIIVLGTFADNIKNQWPQFCYPTNNHPVDINKFTGFPLFSCMQQKAAGQDDNVSSEPPLPPTVIVLPSSSYKFIESEPFIFIYRHRSHLCVYSCFHDHAKEVERYSYKTERKRNWENAAHFILQDWRSMYRDFLENSQN